MSEDKLLSLSLQPDEHLKWVYDYRHRDYNSDYAKSIRARRHEAIRSGPKYMLDLAIQNDDRRYRERDSYRGYK